MKRISLLAILLMATAAGCRSQAPTPSAPKATITWTAPTSPACNTGAPCTYIVTRAVCSTATTCPANPTTNAAWVQLNGSTPTSNLSFVDTAPPQGALVSYVVTTLQSGGTSVPSSPSNGGTPLSIPVVPGAPGTVTSTETAALAPLLLPDAPEPQTVASADAPATVRDVHVTLSR